MTLQEFSNEFDVLYNNITSNQAPGLNEYEKSVFLTKAQDDIVKSYFDPKLNKSMSGFDGSQRRQIDFSMIMKTLNLCPPYFEQADFDNKNNTRKINLPKDVLMFINESVQVVRDCHYNFPNIVVSDEIDDESKKNPTLNKPKEYEAGDRLYIVKTGCPEGINSYRYLLGRTPEGKTYKLKLHDGDEFYASDDNNDCKLNIWQSYGFTQYGSKNNVEFFLYDGVNVEDAHYVFTKLTTLTVIPISYADYAISSSKPFQRPLKNQAWRIIGNNSGADNYVELIIGPNDILWSYSLRYIKRPQPIVLTNLNVEGLSVDGVENASECELDPILHKEILQRAVEMAKCVYAGDLNSQISLGQNSQTNIGYVGGGQPRQERE